MKSYVVIATKGRPTETGILLDYLARQSQRPDSVVIVGTEEADIEDLRTHTLCKEGIGVCLISDRAGLPIQRNVGLEHLKATVLPKPSEALDAHVSFFDDDFRPADNWLEQASAIFTNQSKLVGITGNVVADGVRIGGVSEIEATKYLSGELPAQDHWASGEQRVLTSMYGCNMAFRANVFETCSFDERLPLYAWQEDRDFTGQASEFGDCVLAPDCKGVHLGVTGGRGSGVRLGYSQIANLAYLWRKGTVSGGSALHLMVRSFGSNTLRSVRYNPRVDYRGRFRGNMMALGDIMLGRFRPERIVEL